MIEKLNVTKIINVTREPVWTAISSAGGLDRWFPVIASCRVEGEGVGAVRYLELDNGGAIKDVVKEINHAESKFVYVRTESPFPVNRYEGEVTVRNSDGGKTEISWTVEIDIDEHSDELNAFVRNALSDGISGIERDLQ